MNRSISYKNGTKADTGWPCSRSFREQLQGNLDSFTRCEVKQPPGSMRFAAVAVTVIDFRHQGNLAGLGEQRDDSAALILTRRSPMLRSHAGQWALPGGRIDPEESPVETALRELREEVGLHLTRDNLMGLLDDYVTRSGFHITPVVFWGGTVGKLQKNDGEVASIHRIPCSELARQDAPLLENGVVPGRQVLYMPVGNTVIAAPTAAVLFQFREVAMFGKSSRVAHYDQPYFAWK
ncbi:NUDIX hydrolase [Desulforhopalus singaporensis]|uniref:NUDIX domain-containing protein n=1 Tax=Desulforhopalus singaporensis TaxID=91360 RepID=A0A1H0NZ87_9BACT|nr:CoA pyrophosphatase [Desulforhopalus singaporensis]SDO98112.1 NUDIX domain-containing protein [Desulforhopalus singaporensis]